MYRYLSLLFALVLLSGCYYREEVQEYEIGLVFDNGITLTKVVGAGRYSDSAYSADFRQVNVAAKTSIWTDQSLATSDKQIIGATVGLTYRRSPVAEKAEAMYQLYQTEMFDDAALERLVFDRLARAAKQVTSEFSLDDMLGTGTATGDRAALAARLKEVLDPALAAAGIDLLEIGFNDIQPSDTYLASLDAKAKAAADRELSTAETFKLQQQLEQEKAQTAIELEKASRNRQIALLESQVLDESPAKLELEKARIYAQAMSDKDKVYFIQPGTDISLFFGASTPVVTE